MLWYDMIGALDGDGMPGDFAERGVDMKTFFATLPYTTVIKPRVDGVMAHLLSLGVTKVALVGFCWGGWVVSHMLSESDYAEGSLTHCRNTMMIVIL